MHLTAVITACLRVHEMRYNPDADSQTHALFNDNILRIICVENNVLSDEGLFRAFNVYPPPIYKALVSNPLTSLANAVNEGRQVF